jgi:hypothetical protein
VLPGPGSGVANVAETFDEFGVVAWNRRGQVLWRNFDAAACGNCDEGPHPVRRHPDGSYGPLGYVADDAYWAVDQQGRRIDGCAGAVSTDGTCVETKNDAGLVEGELTPGATMFARKDGVRLWEHVEGGFLGVGPDGDFSTLTVRDRLGIAYAAMQGDQGGRVVAVDAATGALRWRVLGGQPEMLSALGSGVLVLKEGSLVALGESGARRWTRALPPGAVATPRTTFVDTARGRVYVGLRLRSPGATSTGQVLGLDEVTGALRWRTPRLEVAQPLSVGPSGRVYVATSRRGLSALRAIDPAGRGVWRYPTARPVVGAAEIARGRVALATKGDNLNFDSGPLLFLVNPRRKARAPRRNQFTLTPTRRIGQCFFESVDPKGCATLRMTLRAPQRLSLRLRRTGGRRLDFDVRVVAPRGTSYLRLDLGRPSQARGKYVLEILTSRKKVLRRIPLTVA